MKRFVIKNRGQIVNLFTEEELDKRQNLIGQAIKAATALKKSLADLDEMETGIISDFRYVIDKILGEGRRMDDGLIVVLEGISESTPFTETNYPKEWDIEEFQSAQMIGEKMQKDMLKGDSV